jgi:predicted enzyme related to lactoylglutathione lyase
MLGLRTVIYHVPDIEAAKLWYEKVTGIKPYFDQAFYVGFNVGGYELGLHPSEDKPQSRTTNVVAYWGVDDVQKEYKRLLSLGAKEHEAPQEVGEGIVVAAVKDPWNNVFGLIYNPHFKLT